MKDNINLYNEETKKLDLFGTDNQSDSKGDKYPIKESTTFKADTDIIEDLTLSLGCYVDELHKCLAKISEFSSYESIFILHKRLYDAMGFILQNPETVIEYLSEGTMLGRYNYLYYDWCECLTYIETIKSKYIELYNAPSQMIRDLDDFSNMINPIKYGLEQRCSTNQLDKIF